MIKEQRRFKRCQTRLEVELTLYDTDTGAHLTDSLAGRIFNISKGGAVLELNEVIRQGRHLFFAPLESDNITFELKIYYFKDEQVQSLSLLARPIWYNRNMDIEVSVFLMGVEFQERLPRKITDNLNS